MIQDYTGHFSLQTFDASQIHVDLGWGNQSCVLDRDCYSFFDMMTDQELPIVSPTKAGSYFINLNAKGLARLNARGDGIYKFNNTSYIAVYLSDLDQAYIKTKFIDGAGSKQYAKSDQPLPVDDQNVQITVSDYSNQLGTYAPRPGDLEYLDKYGKLVDPQVVGTIGDSFGQAYYIYLSPQGMRNLQAALPYVKGFASPSTIDLAKITVIGPAEPVTLGRIVISDDENHWSSFVGEDTTNNLAHFKVQRMDENRNWSTVELQPGDLVFYDLQGNRVTPDHVSWYNVNVSPQLLNRLNSTMPYANFYSLQRSSGCLYYVMGRATAQVVGPQRISWRDARHLEKMGYQVKMTYNGRTIISDYHPIKWDLELVDDAGNVVTDPHISGNYRVRLSKQGYLSVGLSKKDFATHYKVTADIPQAVQLYQPYDPTPADYQQNYGNLDGYSLRPVSDSQAALHVAGWHASGASAVLSNGYLIVFDNTLGKEIKRVAIKPVNRPDVRAAYQNVYGSLESGFDQDILIPLANAGDDLTVIARYSDDPVGGEGQRIDHWFARINADHGNHAWIDSVQYVDGHFRVNGWHATNQALGKDHHTLIVWDASQGKELTRITELPAVARPDLVKAFPTILGADHAGFSVDIPLLTAMTTDKIQFISRYSSTADANRDYIDYWFAPQQLLSDHRNQAYLDQVSVQNGKLHLAGWHATNQSIGRPYHTLIILNANNGQELRRLTTKQTVSRPDLTRVFPGIVTAEANGFNADLDLVAGMGDQPIRIVSRWSATADANSDYVDYWFAPQQLFSDLANRANLDSWGVQGRTLHAAGWHATSQSAGRPYHYLILFDQTTQREIKRVRVTANSARPDVARAFPGVYNAGDAGFDVSFKLNSRTNGHRLTILSRWTSDPAGNGNAIDYWFGSMLAPELSLVPTSGKNSPADHDVEKAFHIDSIRFIGTKQHPQIQVSGWAASNYCADWDQQMTGDPQVDSEILQQARTVEVIFGGFEGNQGWAAGYQYGDVNGMSQIIRPDVAAAYPEIWGSRYSGFTFIVDSSIEASEDC
ncbi:MAG: hypothetical protein ACFN06_00835 [Limosilactobacillus oris]